MYNDDGDRNGRRVEKVVMITRHPGMAHTMTHATIVSVMAGPRSASSLGETGLSWPKQRKMMSLLSSWLRSVPLQP